MQSKRSSIFRAAFLGTVLTGVTSGIVVVGLASATQAFADQASASFVVPKAKCGPNDHPEICAAGPSAGEFT